MLGLSFGFPTAFAEEKFVPEAFLLNSTNNNLQSGIENIGWLCQKEELWLCMWESWLTSKLGGSDLIVSTSDLQIDIIYLLGSKNLIVWSGVFSI